MANRPLFHPPIESVTVAGILHALSDPVRLAIVSELQGAREGLSCVETKDRIAATMPKSTCSTHFQILREAGLIWSERKGVEHSTRLRQDELTIRFPGLLESVLKAYRKEVSKTGKRKKGAG